MFDMFKRGEPRRDKDQIASRSQCPIHISEGDKISIHRGGPVPKQWRGIVHMVTNTAFAMDSPALFAESVFPLQDHSRVDASISMGERTAKFTTKLLKAVHDHKPPIIILEFPTEFEWNEPKDREYVSVKTDVPAKAKVEGKEDSPWQMVRIVDFSIGGMVLSSPLAYITGDKLRIDFMSFEVPVKPVAVVASSVKDEEKKDYTIYKIALKFENLNDSDKQMLSNFAYKLQRKTY